MKRLFFILTLAFSIGLVSCQKEDITPNQDEVVDAGTIEQEISIFGEWKLLDGKMFMENIETGEKTVYAHFDANKTVSSLRYSGSMFDFETIEQNVTTWEFVQPPMVPGTGDFILNGDVANPMGFYMTVNNWTIVEHPTASNAQEMQLGGSSRPISAYVEDYDQKIINFYVQEAYESIDGYNYKYFSELTFQKQ